MLAIGSALVWGGAVAAQELTLRVANVMGPAHDTSAALNRFAELVEERSGGRIDVQHYPGGQLGSDRETFEATQMGVLDLAGGSSANIATITRAFEFLHLPFIFDGLDDAHQALDSEDVRDRVNKQLATVGMQWMTTFDFGFRDISNIRGDVMVPSDLAGMKMRVSRSTLEIAGINAFGASPVVVDWPEVYNALRFGIVDGQGQPFTTQISARHQEVLRYQTDVNWQYYGFVVLSSRKRWDSYPDWAREIITEALAEAQVFHRGYIVEAEEKAKAAFLEAGGKFTELTEEQRQPWRDAGMSTWPASGVPQDMIELVQHEIQ